MNLTKLLRNSMIPVVAIGSVVASTASAQTIISTDFVSAASPQNLYNGAGGNTNGLVTNLPGGVWQQLGGNDNDTVITATYYGAWQQNAVRVGDGAGGAALSISSAGSYTKPTSFTISSQIGIEQSGSITALGFWTQTGVGLSSTTTSFTGLTLAQDGTVNLWLAGTQQVGAGTSLSLGTTLTTQTYYTVSYDVDTTTGALSNFTVNGTGYSGISTTGFTDGATTYAGFASIISGQGADFKDFSVSVAAVPEPSAWGLVGMACIGLLVFRRRQLKAAQI